MGLATSTSNLLDEVDVTIANAASLSDSKEIGGALLVGILMPSGWTTADLTFQASRDGATFADVYEDNLEMKIVSPAASRWIAIEPSRLVGARYVKVRSGTAAVPVNQAAARILKLLLRAG